MPEQTAAPAAIELAPLPSLTELTREFWRELIGGRIRVADGEQPTPDRGNGSGAWAD